MFITGSGLEALLLTLVILAVQYVIYIELQNKENRRMTFWSNWSAWAGTLAFAGINGLLFPRVIQGHGQWQHLSAIAIGLVFSLSFFSYWRSRPGENSGHIISPSGSIEPSGMVFFFYLWVQGYIIALAVITPLALWKLSMIWALFAFQLILQQVQAVVVQGCGKLRAIITAILFVTALSTVCLMKYIEGF